MVGCVRVSLRLRAACFGSALLGVVFFDRLFEVPQLLGHVVQAELDGVENPELEVFHLGRLVHHPNNLDRNQQYGDLIIQIDILFPQKY